MTQCPTDGHRSDRLAGAAVGQPLRTGPTPRRLTLLFAGWTLMIGPPTLAAASPLVEWLDRFYAAYGEFDGSHLDFYDEECELRDETAGMTLHSRAELQAFYEQSRATYERVHWKIEESLIDGNRAAVRGRVQGRALDRDFDVSFTTWLVVENERIIRQVDYVDYAKLREQLQPPGENSGSPPR